MWKDWKSTCQENGISKTTFYWRVNSGLSPEVAATQPLSGPRAQHKSSPYADRDRGSRRSFQPFQEDEAALNQYLEARNLPLSDLVAELIHERLQNKN